MAKLADLTQQDHEQFQAFCHAGYRNKRAAALREEMRPAVLDHLRQAHDLLGLIASAFEPGGEQPGLIVAGYYEQYENHMESALALLKQLVLRTNEILQEEAQ